MKQTRNIFHVRTCFTCSIISYIINFAPDFGQKKKKILPQEFFFGP